jgi:hypothetical protein
MEARKEFSGRNVATAKQCEVTDTETAAFGTDAKVSEGSQWNLDPDQMIRKKTIKRNKNKILKTFKKGLNQFIMTSRFNNSTWSENNQFRQTVNDHNMEHNVATAQQGAGSNKNTNNTIGCIYCAPNKVAQYIPVESHMFVLEMNNDTNKIMGIGLVRNHPICNKYRVYKNGNYNRYVYVSKHRIDRADMTESEETIMKAFDILCFTGNRHMKRGQGLMAFPIDMIYRCRTIIDLVKFIGDMFKERSTK